MTVVLAILKLLNKLGHKYKKIQFYVANTVFHVAFAHFLHVSQNIHINSGIFANFVSHFSTHVP